MTKIRGGTPGLGARRSLKGAFTISGDPQKLLVARGWPRKRVGKPSPAQIEAQTNFRNICNWIKVASGEAIDAALEGSEASPYYWRDLLMSTAFGRVVQVETTNGLILRGVLILSQTIQSLLDQIGQDVGDLIYRTTDGWVALPQGANGDLLTAGGPGLLPSWQPPEAAPVTAITYTAFMATASIQVNTAGTATVSQVQRPYVDLDVSAVWVLLDATAAQAYTVTVTPVTVSGSTATFGTPLATSSLTIASTNSAMWVRFPFSSAVSLAQGTDYAFTISITSGSGSTPCPVYYSPGMTASWPMPMQPIGQINYAKSTVTNGDAETFGNFINYAYALGVEWAYPI
jgi:hypothetical protein